MAWLPVVVLSDPATRDSALAQLRAKGTATASIFLTILLNGLVGTTASSLFSPILRKETRRCTLEVHASWTAAMDDLHQLIRKGAASSTTASNWLPPELAKSVRLIAQDESAGGLRGRFDRELAEHPDGKCPRCHAAVIPRLEQAFRFLLRAEPVAMLAGFKPDRALALEFWELVPDGALDGVKDAKWLMKMARSTKRQLSVDTARAVFCELRRVAPATSVGALESLLASLELK
ncbi:hypothetical protein H9P43_007404 [Blastocladiella emersonii ATCC 22665]|nr:hypothetical protein H9P43_007404 [Blastocladiella emersonii ATCC 22665]